MAYNEVVRFAYQVIDMHREVIRLRRENEELQQLKKKYNELQDECLEAAKVNSSNMFNMITTPGVSKAFLENADPEKFPKGEQ